MAYYFTLVRPDIDTWFVRLYPPTVYRFGATALMFCMIFIYIMEMCMSTGYRYMVCPATVNREILVMVLFWPILVPKYEVPKLNTKICQTPKINRQN